MIGNVWEWTASDFLPFAGFAADPYKDYSQPWFGTRKVLRGGCWATSARIARPAYRNFFTPDRIAVFAGFRTFALYEVLPGLIPFNLSSPRRLVTAIAVMCSWLRG